MRINILSICAVVGLLATASVARAIDEYEHCKSIITDGLREVNIETGSTAYLNTVFDKYCETRGTTKEDVFSIGLDAVVAAIPFKFTLGSSDKKQSMRNFCKEYSSYAASRSDTSRRDEHIVGRAYDSYDMCVSLASQGVKMSHKVRSLEYLDFFIAPAVGRPVVMNGVETSDNIKCSGKNSDSFFSSAKELTRGSRIIVKRTPLNIVCRRTGKAGKDGVVYEEGVVTLLTDIQPYGNYGVVLPRDSRLAENKASELQAAIENQAAALAKIQNSISVLSSPVSASTDLGYSVSRGGGASAMTMASFCQPNQVVVGVELIVGGTCRGQCDPDGGTIHKFRVKCAPRLNIPAQ